MDDYGHGTHTSGIVAAVGDNAVGVAGLGWSTKIMALKFINYDGGGTDADAIECIDYAVREKLEHGVNVVAINASWGGGASQPLPAQRHQRGRATRGSCSSRPPATTPRTTTTQPALSVQLRLSDHRVRRGDGVGRPPGVLLQLGPRVGRPRGAR